MPAPYLALYEYDFIESWHICFSFSSNSRMLDSDATVRNSFYWFGILGDHLLEKLAVHTYMSLDTTFYLSQDESQKDHIGQGSN